MSSERHALDAGFVAGLVVDHLAAGSRGARPFQIHAQQHLGPVLRLGAAGARMDGDDRVGAIVLAAEHLPGFRRVDLLLQLVERAREVGVDVFARTGPFDQDADVVGAARQRFEQRPIFLEPPAALHDLLRLGLVAPEIGSRDARLYFGELFIEVGALKDASAARAIACSGPRTAW